MGLKLLCWVTVYTDKLERQKSAPGYKEMSRRGIYAFCSLVHLSSMFWWASIINNVSNWRHGASGCVCTRYRLSREGDLGKCWFSACLPLRNTAQSYSSPSFQRCFSFSKFFHVPASACGAVPSFHSTSAALLPFSFLLRDEGIKPCPTGKTSVLAQKCSAAGNVYFSICVGFYWFLLARENPHVYMTTPCSGSISLYRHAHAYTDVSLTALVSWWCRTRIHSVLHQ